MSDIVSIDNSEITTNLDQFHAGLRDYLAICGLPSDDVLVEVRQRALVIKNLPAVVSDLSDDQRKAAMYISKFTAACASGLFDAALSYLWDETIRNLRLKVSRFDLDYFFDTVVKDQKQRPKFSSETDLESLQDWDLITGCRDTGIIGKVGYMHLDYIRNMRNHASAAHPNQNELTGLQLVSWLETCIKEVLAKEPEGPAIEARRLLNSLRNEVLSQDDVPHIATALKAMPNDVLVSLVRSAFGMYTDSAIEAQVRSNIGLIAPDMWAVCPDDGRYEIGVRAASFRVNGEASRAKLGRAFLDLVHGLPYLPEDTLSVEMSAALDDLIQAHNGYNNFHNEPSPARSLAKYVPDNGIVPPSVAARYVKVVTMCKIGNGYGVSNAAMPTYNSLIGCWQEDHVRSFVHLLEDDSVRSRLQFTPCATNYRQLADHFATRVTDQNLKEALDAIVSFPPNQLHNASKDANFKRHLARV